MTSLSVIPPKSSHHPSGSSWPAITTKHSTTMAVLKSTPTATAPARPMCTIIAKTELYHTYVSEHWPYCIIKQTYNPSGANFIVSTNSSYTSPSSTPTAKDSPVSSAAISAYIPLGIIAAVGISFFTYLIISKITHAIEKCKRRWRGVQPASNPRPKRRTGFRAVINWFSSKYASLFGRNQDRSLESAERMSPLQRSLQRIRIFGKSSSRVPPYPRPNPDMDPNAGASGPNPNLEFDVLPPAYQSAEHLPPPALPLAAHLPGGQRQRVADGSIIQGESLRVGRRIEPPPPDYRDRHQDTLYTSETESEPVGDTDSWSESSADAIGRGWNEYWQSINHG